MKIIYLTGLLALLLLSGCASHPAPPQDDAMEVAISAGRQAMDNHQAEDEDGEDEAEEADAPAGDDPETPAA